MEPKKGPRERKYSRRKNSNACEAALNSLPSGEGMGSISRELAGIAKIITKKLKGNNFCMREHVAGMLEKNVRKCYPFRYEGDVNIAKLKQYLPPVDLPEKILVDLSVDEPSNESPVAARLALPCSTVAEWSNQVPQIGDSHLEIDVPEVITMNASDEANILSNSHHHELLEGDQEKSSEAAKRATIGRQTSLDDSDNNLIPELRIAFVSSAAYSGLIQDDCELTDDEPANNNLNLLDKHNNESSESEEPVVADRQQNTAQLTKSAVRSAVAKVADEDDKTQPAGITLAVSENSNSFNSRRILRRKTQKTRRMRDILGDASSMPQAQLHREQDAPHDASAEIVFPAPQANVDNQTNPRNVARNRKRKLPAEEVNIFEQMTSDKEVEQAARKLRELSRGEDSFTCRLSQNGVINRSWTCSRPRKPRRKTARIRFALEPIQEDERENEDSSDEATLSDDLELKSAPSKFNRKGTANFPLCNDSSADSNEAKRKGGPGEPKPSRQMAKFEMPGTTDDKHDWFSKVEDGIYIVKEQKVQATDHKRRRNQELEIPVSVPDTGNLRLLGKQVSIKEMSKERTEGANKAKSSDYFSSLGGNHFHLNSDDQSRISFGTPEVSMSKAKAKAPSDITSLRGSSSGLDSGEPKMKGVLGEASRQMVNFEMPGTKDKLGCISQVDRIYICNQQKGQATEKRSNPYYVPGTVKLGLFGQQAARREMSEERKKWANKSKSIDYLSCRGGQPSDSPFGAAEVSLSKPMVPYIPSLRGSSTGLNGGILLHGYSNTRLQESGGCDIHRHILDPNGEAHRIWTSKTPMQVMITNGKEASQLMNNPRPVFDLNVPCPEHLESDYYGMEEFSFPGNPSGPELEQNLKGPANSYSNYAIPAMNLLSLMTSSKLSCAQQRNQSSYPLASNLCLSGSGKSELRNTSTLQNSSSHVNMKNSRSCAQEMTTKSKGSTSKVSDDEFPQDSCIVSFGSSSQQTLPASPSPCARARARARATSIALAAVPENMICVLNQNPADFSIIQTGNPYLINGEDVKFESVSTNPHQYSRFRTNLTVASEKDSATN